MSAALLPAERNGAPTEHGWWVAERTVFAGELLCVVHVTEVGRIHLGQEEVPPQAILRHAPLVLADTPAR